MDKRQQEVWKKNNHKIESNFMCYLSKKQQKNDLNYEQTKWFDHKYDPRSIVVIQFEFTIYVVLFC